MRRPRLLSGSGLRLPFPPSWLLSSGGPGLRPARKLKGAWRSFRPWVPCGPKSGPRSFPLPPALRCLQLSSSLPSCGWVLNHCSEPAASQVRRRRNAPNASPSASAAASRACGGCVQGANSGLRWLQKSAAPHPRGVPDPPHPGRAQPAALQAPSGLGTCDAPTCSTAPGASRPAGSEASAAPEPRAPSARAPRRHFAAARPEPGEASASESAPRAAQSEWFGAPGRTERNELPVAFNSQRRS